jgi:hypothetical protein
MSTLTRAEFLGKLGAGAAAALVAACTPVRILLRAYPDAFDRPAVSEPVLRAFVTTVIPGAKADAPHLVRAYFDAEYPFARHAGFFAHDLNARALRRFGAGLATLPRAPRARVVEEGLTGDATTRKLYRAAIFIAQASFYAGIYDDQAGCELIEYRGASELLPLAQQVHPSPERFFGRGLTGDGNFH